LFCCFVAHQRGSTAQSAKNYSPRIGFSATWTRSSWARNSWARSSWTRNSRTRRKRIQRRCTACAT